MPDEFTFGGLHSMPIRVDSPGPPPGFPMAVRLSLGRNTTHLTPAPALRVADALREHAAACKVVTPTAQDGDTA